MGSGFRFRVLGMVQGLGSGFRGFRFMLRGSGSGFSSGSSSGSGWFRFDSGLVQEPTITQGAMTHALRWTLSRSCWSAQG